MKSILILQCLYNVKALVLIQYKELVCNWCCHETSHLLINDFCFLRILQTPDEMSGLIPQKIATNYGLDLCF